jgi:hypothetical protein
MYVRRCEKDNGSIARFRDSSRRREKTMTTTCSSKPDVPLVVSMDCKCKRLFFPIKQVRKKLIPERDPCMQI